jgi:uncharacterized protein (DUF427 family)
LTIERIKPGPGQESVWDYPRPPKLEDFEGQITVIFNDILIAETQTAKRVLETSHPPVYYIQPKDIKMEYLEKSSHSSWCEWKGKAAYYDVQVNGRRASKAAWYYPEPVNNFREITNYLAFYAESMDVCYANGEKVKPQPGNFYGGWITNNVVGPFKGLPGSWHW